MFITFVRAIILYIVVLIVMRLMGKREIGQLQPFELAISIMIADLASVPMTELRHSHYEWNYSHFGVVNDASFDFYIGYEKHFFSQNNVRTTIYINLQREDR